MFKKNSFYLICFMFFYSSITYANEKYKVSSNDTLSRIAVKFYKNSVLTKEQLYVGLLAENPHAFSYGNINYLKGGVMMTLPDVDKMSLMSHEDATNLLAKHTLNTKSKLPPPFENRMTLSEESDLKDLFVKQQEASERLKQINLQTEQLKQRLEEVSQENAAQDKELDKLDKLLTDK